MAEAVPTNLLCRECGETCGLAKGCDAYPTKDDPHVHLPGGLKTYGLCEPCLKKCLDVHRPVAADGTWKWIHDCGSPSCGYCKALAIELEKFGVRRKGAKET